MLLGSSIAKSRQVPNSREGHDLKPASKSCSGVDEALRLIRAGELRLDAIVCDVMMPHGDSFTAAETDENRLTGLVCTVIRKREKWSFEIAALARCHSARDWPGRLTSALYILRVAMEGGGILRPGVARIAAA